MLGIRSSRKGVSRNMACELVVFDVDGTLAEVGKLARRFANVCGVLDLLVDELE